jgi:molybdate transport repressor ModE-like protein
MQRRHQHINIPTEIVRTLVTIAELGSFSKAGEKLGLSQPAISAQVKRLHLLVGGPVFEKAAGGVTFTQQGKSILTYARRLLEANDQILALGGAVGEGQPLRLGLSSAYSVLFMKSWQTAKCREPLSIICAHSSELSKSFADGHLDIACLVHPPREFEDPLFEWREEYVWVRNRDFVLRPGSPIPVIAVPGSLHDQPMITALEKAGLAYRVVFTSADHHARFTAVIAGVGVMAVPRMLVTEALTVAREYYLPHLAPLRAGVFLRGHADVEKYGSVIELLKQLSQRSVPSPKIADIPINSDDAINSACL